MFTFLVWLASAEAVRSSMPVVHAVHPTQGRRLCGGERGPHARRREMARASEVLECASVVHTAVVGC